MPIRTNRNQNLFPTFFDEFFGNEWLPMNRNTAPAINVAESDKDYKVELAAPGMTKEDFKIRITPNHELVISMEKKSEEKQEEPKKYIRREFSYSKFEQTLLLPENVNEENISATMNDGILNIELPKYSPDEEPKKHKEIEIH